VMNADGSNEEQITFTDDSYGPKYSPNGKWIVFTDDTEDGDVTIVRPDGSNFRVLTDDGDDGPYEANGVFTPDGRRILYASEDSGGFQQIFVMKANGSGQKALRTGDEESNHGAVGTLDGKNRIVFMNTPSFEDQEIWSMNSKGKDPRQLTDNDVADRGPEAVPTLKCGKKFATIIGTSKSERLRGGPGKDVIAGLGGKDKLIGLGGKDILCGGARKDSIDAGRGKDTCIGGGGEDKAKSCNKLKQIP
jgi:Ca2+-binding RTX toxin-like protein